MRGGREERRRRRGRREEGKRRSLVTGEFGLELTDRWTNIPRFTSPVFLLLLLFLLLFPILLRSLFHTLFYAFLHSFLSILQVNFFPSSSSFSFAFNTFFFTYLSFILFFLTLNLTTFPSSLLISILRQILPLFTYQTPSIPSFSSFISSFCLLRHLNADRPFLPPLSPAHLPTHPPTHQPTSPPTQRPLLRWALGGWMVAEREGPCTSRPQPEGGGGRGEEGGGRGRKALTSLEKLN